MFNFFTVEYYILSTSFSKSCRFVVYLHAFSARRTISWHPLFQTSLHKRDTIDPHTAHTSAVSLLDFRKFNIFTIFFLHIFWRNVNTKHYFSSFITISAGVWLPLVLASLSDIIGFNIRLRISHEARQSSTRVLNYWKSR